jgi:hypothetical protein
MWSTALQSSETNMETSRKFAKKKERNQMGKGACCKVLFSLFGVVEIPSFMMIQPPSPASNILF